MTEIENRSTDEEMANCLNKFVVRNASKLAVHKQVKMPKYPQSLNIESNFEPQEITIDELKELRPLAAY